MSTTSEWPIQGADAAQNVGHIIYNAERKELLLTGRQLKTVPPDLVQRFAVRTEYLDLSHNRVVYFDWVKAFTQLKYLILDSNRLHEAYLRRISEPLLSVKVLTLNKNELSDLTTTVMLLGSYFPNLEYLSLHGNPICPDGLEVPFGEFVDYEYDHYRTELTKALPKLKFLDHASTTAQLTLKPATEASHFLSFAPKILWAKLRSALSTQESSAGMQRHKTTMPPLARSYSGHNSEGNRFILNQDL